ncbi:hypothetical protein FPE01S_03_04530 [Flavihumibacter petaseus NBRC 106054]|uniref:Uncharacterized protein n=1 Tax=Flavihumibacter petaseus NBRC 106054 TaxID=1220578 RepID=A0A0E9N4Z7_9BACT|nr:hypothetical protein FPE01S_03_04530 [Flavihumibacter petaseus NBRC 106054]
MGGWMEDEWVNGEWANVNPIANGSSCLNFCNAVWWPISVNQTNYQICEKHIPLQIIYSLRPCTYLSEPCAKERETLCEIAQASPTEALA